MIPHVNFLYLLPCLLRRKGRDRKGKERFGLNGGFVWENCLHHYFVALNNGHYILSKQCQYSQALFKTK